MNLEKYSERYEPPKGGFRRVWIDIEDGPRWTDEFYSSTGKRTQEMGIVRVVVTIYDSGSYSWGFYYSRIRKDGQPYKERPSRLYNYEERKRSAEIEEVRREVLASGILNS